MAIARQCKQDAPQFVKDVWGDFAAAFDEYEPNFRSLPENDPARKLKERQREFFFDELEACKTKVDFYFFRERWKQRLLQGTFVNHPIRNVIIGIASVMFSAGFGLLYLKFHKGHSRLWDSLRDKFAYGDGNVKNWKVDALLDETNQASDVQQSQLSELAGFYHKCNGAPIDVTITEEAGLNTQASKEVIEEQLTGFYVTRKLPQYERGHLYDMLYGNVFDSNVGKVVSDEFNFDSTVTGSKFLTDSSANLEQYNPDTAGVRSIAKLNRLKNRVKKWFNNLKLDMQSTSHRLRVANQKLKAFLNKKTEVVVGYQGQTYQDADFNALARLKEKLSSARFNALEKLLSYIQAEHRSIKKNTWLVVLRLLNNILFSPSAITESLKALSNIEGVTESLKNCLIQMYSDVQGDECGVGLNVSLFEDRLLVQQLLSPFNDALRSSFSLGELGEDQRLIKSKDEINLYAKLRVQILSEFSELLDSDRCQSLALMLVYLELKQDQIQKNQLVVILNFLHLLLFSNVPINIIIRDMFSSYGNEGSVIKNAIDQELRVYFDEISKFVLSNRDQVASRFLDQTNDEHRIKVDAFLSMSRDSWSGKLDKTDIQLYRWFVDGLEAKKNARDKVVDAFRVVAKSPNKFADMRYSREPKVLSQFKMMGSQHSKIQEIEKALVQRRFPQHRIDMVKAALVYLDHHLQPQNKTKDSVNRIQSAVDFLQGMLSCPQGRIGEYLKGEFIDEQGKQRYYYFFGLDSGKFLSCIKYWRFHAKGYDDIENGYGQDSFLSRQESNAVFGLIFDHDLVWGINQSQPEEGQNYHKRKALIPGGDSHSMLGYVMPADIAAWTRESQRLAS